MKLKQLLEVLFDSGYFTNDILDYDQLKKLKDHILKCDEFQDVEKLEFVKQPNFKNEITGRIMTTKSYKLCDETKFGGVCYIFSIEVTPEIYRSEAFHKPVKDGACITPTMYNPFNFEPVKYICVEFNPESIWNTSDTNKKDELIKRFMNVLKSPEEYLVKGQREFIIRGIL